MTKYKPYTLPELENIFYKQEIYSFLQSFVSSEDDILSGRAPETAPTSTKQVLQDIQDIWEQADTPLLHPAQMREALLQKYMPDADPKLLDICNQVERSRYQPEALTGFFEKQHLGVISGLGHLYAVSNRQSVSMIEVDYSNMGGTNEHFRDVLAQELNIPLENVSDEEAFALTDLSARLIAKTIQAEIRDKIGSDGVLLPVRAGGDELRLIATHIPTNQYAELTAHIHNSIEEHMARLDLHDHIHLKDRNNPYKNGFGAALSMMDMRNICPSIIVHQADLEIKAQKMILGQQRLGEINAESTHAAYSAYYKENPDQLPDGANADTYAAHLVKVEAEKAKNKRQYFVTLKTSLNGGINAKRAYINKAIANLHIDEKKYTGGTTPKFMTQNAENAVPFSPPAARRHACVIKETAQQGITIKDGYEATYLEHIALQTTPVDSSSQTWMPDDLPEMLEIYVQDAKTLITKDTLVPNTPEGLPFPLAMSLGFHNLGGLNDVLGHDGANIALRYMSHDIIRQSFTDEGIPEEDYTLAHYGGAEFQIIIKPSCTRDIDVLDKLEQRITDKTQQMNTMSLVKFLEDADMPPPKDLRETIKDMTFADIPDIKPDRNISGMDVVTHSRPVILGYPKLRTGQLLYNMRRALETETHQHRTNIIQNRQDNTQSRFLPQSGKKTTEQKTDTKRQHTSAPQNKGRKPTR